jgi:hypothetical protein
LLMYPLMFYLRSFYRSFFKKDKATDHHCWKVFFKERFGKSAIIKYTFHIIRVMSILNSSRLCNRIEFQVYSFFSTYSQPFCPESSVLLVSVILIIPFFFSLAVEVFLYFTYKSDYIYCSCWRAGFFPFQQVGPHEVI